MSDEILITPLIGNCEVFVARGVGSFSRYRSPSYSAIDLRLIHLIVIIPPPYFICFRDGGFFSWMLLEKLTSGGFCVCGGKIKEMHSTAVIKRDFCIWVKINVKAGIKSAIHVKYTL